MPIGLEQWRAQIGALEAQRYRYLSRAARKAARGGRSRVCRVSGRGMRCWVGFGVGVTLLGLIVSFSLLLLRAGDVEKNPGPLTTQLEAVSDKFLAKVDDTEISDGDIYDVYDEVVSIARRWRNMYFSLHLLPPDPSAIGRTYPNNNERCLRVVLLNWLQKGYNTHTYGPPTWRMLVKAVADHAGGDSTDLAEIIAKNHPLAGLQQPESSTGILKYASYLKSSYSQSVSSSHDFHLATICSPDVADDFATRGHMDMIGKREPIKVEDVFKSELGKELKYVLVEGEHGSGKTAFSLEICKRWADGRLLHHFSLVILLQLNDETVQNVTTIQELFPHRDIHLQQQVTQEVVMTGGSSMLLILEGLDVLPSYVLTQSSLFTKLLSGFVLPNVTILIASHPSAVPLLKSTLKAQHISRHVYIELPPDLLLNDALDKGYVNARIMICLLTGAAGSGKSHFTHLALQLPPPKERNSTGLADEPYRAVSVVQATVPDMKTSDMKTSDDWKQIKPEDVLPMVADAIKAGILKDSQRSERGSARTDGLLHARPVEHPSQSSSQHEVMFEGDSDATSSTKSETSRRMMHQTNSETSTTHQTNSQTSMTHQTNSETSMTHQTNSADLDDHKVPSFRGPIEIVKSQLTELISQSRGSRELFNMNWIYMIDTGGQPQFQEILPVFVHNVSAVIFTLKLNEPLDHCPTVKYYKKDKLIASYKSPCTHRQLIMHSIQAMHSRHPLEDFQSVPKVFVIGTHKDEAYRNPCPESLKMKNQTLCDLLYPAVGESLVYYHLSDPNEVIFPVNAKTPEPDDHRVAQEFRKSVTQNCVDKSLKIPVAWFALEQCIRQVADESKVGILARKECLQLAQHLNMNESAFEAAMKYLTDLKIILYYPKVLPDVVFTNSTLLLDKISELVEHSYRLWGKSEPCSSRTSTSNLCNSQQLRFRNYGIITIDLLKAFPKNYQEELFTSTDFLKLLTQLLLVAPLSYDEHFMPCLLRELPEEKLQLNRTKLDSSSTITPLLIVCRGNKWLPCGVFTLLVAYLQSETAWKISTRYQKPVLLHQNCAKFEHPKHPGTVTLIDTFKYLEVHLKSMHSSLCASIKWDIYDGLCKASLTLGYHDIVFDDAFFCLQRDDNCEHSLHCALIDRIGGKWFCSINREVYGSLDDQHKHWLGIRSVQEESDEKPSLAQLLLMKTASGEKIQIIKTVATRWRDVGILLDFDPEGDKVAEIEANHSRSGVRACCQEMFRHWLSGGGRPATWATLIEVLEDEDYTHLAGQVRLALGVSD